MFNVYLVVVFTDSSCIFSRVFSTASSCIFRGCIHRLLRRYRATSPNLGEEPSYRIGCYCHWAFHSLFQLWYIGSSPKLGEVAR
ncbi:MAG: hypothetical protein LUD00_03730 [Prevotellaceae bacterium]|nr:hypothetical protein [Prevotellaceae bacterium]